MKKIVVFTLVSFFVFCNFKPIWAQSEESEDIAPCKECDELLKLDLPDVLITDASVRGTNTRWCRVRGTIGDEIKFNLLLPLSWNQIFVMGGGGGFVGSVHNQQWTKVRQGYATVGTDTGHESTNMEGGWALNNIERQANFGFLAVHRTTETAKAIITDFYDKKPLYSYFMGCSRGGGQALMEAQRYPDDFNGIVCGAPAFDWTGVGLECIDNYRRIYSNDGSEDHIPTAETMDLLHKIVMDKYDSIDGLKDGIINNPEDLKFDFNSLKLCPDNIPGENCFTSLQIEKIKSLFEGVTINGKLIYPGFPVGSEGVLYDYHIKADTSTQYLGYNTTFGVFGSEIYRYLVLNDKEWDLYSYDFNNYWNDTEYAASFLNATSVDYKRFKDNNCKMIIYHGWNDQSLSALKTIQYYNEIKDHDKEVEEYIKMYLLPGMEHCAGGVGPSQVDWLEHIRNWVERGVEPHRVVASKYEDNTVVMTRPIFPYPSLTGYNGHGDPNDHNNFVEIKK